MTAEKDGKNFLISTGSLSVLMKQFQQLLQTFGALFVYLFVWGTK